MDTSRPAGDRLAPPDGRGQPPRRVAQLRGHSHVGRRAGAAVDRGRAAGRTRHDDGARRLPVRRRGADPRLRGGHRARIAALHGAREPHRPRVLPAHPHGDGRDDVPRRIRGLHGPLPRARGDVDRRLRARGVRPTQHLLVRGGAQVFPDRRVRIGLPALRHRAGLWSDGAHELPARRCPTRRRPDPDARHARARPPADRLRVQGGGGAVPHVGARRLRRGADAGHGFHGDGRQDRRVHRPRAHALRGVSRDGAVLAAGDRRARRRDHDRRESRRACAAHAQADAGLQLRRPCRISPGGGVARHAVRCGCRHHVPARLFADDARGLCASGLAWARR